MTKQVLVLIAFLFCSTSISVVAQEKTSQIDCKTAPPMAVLEGHKIISFGVMTARAIHLEKPVYPSIGTFVGGGGTVQIAITIDPRGCVSSAEAISGHPLLRASSVAAARRSSFTPVTLSGTAVWAYGVIVYNFRPPIDLNANWLRLGFESQSSSLLIETLPSDFEVQRQKLIDAADQPNDDRERVAAEVLREIRTELMVDEKSLWLFDVGRILGKLSGRVLTTIEERPQLIPSLISLTETAPPTASRELVKQVKILSRINVNSNEFWKRLRHIEDRIQYFGQ